MNEKSKSTMFTVFSGLLGQIVAVRWYHLALPEELYMGIGLLKQEIGGIKWIK